MRSIITALITLLFITSYNAYVYSGLMGFTDVFMRKAVIYFIFSIFVLPLLAMGNSNKKSSIEIEFRKIAFLIYLVVSSMIIINQFGVIKNPINFLLVFNGLTFAFICMVLISAYRHGIFKNGR